MWQERQLGIFKEDQVIHAVPDDVILNTGQFCSAALLHPYRANHPFREFSLKACAELGYLHKKNGTGHVQVQSGIDGSNGSTSTV